jgi:phosphoglycerate dehydrogenase-like enzyme
MIGLSRHVNRMARSLAERRMGQPQGKTLLGKTVGLIGLGGIGRALIKRLKAFDVRLMGIKRENPEQARRELGLDWAGGPDELKTLLRRSDFVVLCLPLTPESAGMMDAAAFAAMKESAYLINLSRGGLTDRDALEAALAEGRIAGAGLDVFWEEPPDPNDPVFSYNVMATPHIAGSTETAMQGIVRAAAENIRRVENNQPPLHHHNAPSS